MRQPYPAVQFDASGCLDEQNQINFIKRENLQEAYEQALIAAMLQAGFTYPDTPNN